MPSSAISIRGVAKTYGPVHALRNVDLEVEAGEVFALLGPNGAGKTTLVEILEGYRGRSSGEVSVLGVDPDHGDAQWRSRLGMVLQNTAVFDFLSVEETVKHFAGFYPTPLDPAEVIDLVGLGEKRKARCSTLSGGQKRRVDLALGLVGNPELIFLDEPTTGLDPEGRRQLWNVIRSFTALGKTVILTTHYLEEAEALAGRVGIIIGGEIVDIGPPDEIGGESRAVATVSFRADGKLAGRELPPLAGDTARTGDHVSIRTAKPTATVSALIAWASDAGVAEIPALSVKHPSLEDTYLMMVQARGGRSDSTDGAAA
ncbi:MAG: ABC transporter ATP-binding protein [Dehalococcoidia bacterium]